MPIGDPDNLVVRHGSMDAAARSIKHHADKLKEDLHQIEHEVRRVAETWEGDAKTAYHEVQTKWNHNVDEIYQALVAISSKIDIASGDYTSTDKKAAAQFGM